MTLTWPLDMSADVVGSVLSLPEAPPLAPLMKASESLCATAKQDELEWSFVKSLSATKYHARSALVDWK